MVADPRTLGGLSPRSSIWNDRDFRAVLYQVLLGQEKGPRFGSFVAVYGIQNAVNMIDGALARSA